MMRKHRVTKEVKEHLVGVSKDLNRTQAAFLQHCRDRGDTCGSVVPLDVVEQAITTGDLSQMQSLLRKEYGTELPSHPVDKELYTMVFDGASRDGMISSQDVPGVLRGLSSESRWGYFNGLKQLKLKRNKAVHASNMQLRGRQQWLERVRSVNYREIVVDPNAPVPHDKVQQELEQHQHKYRIQGVILEEEASSGEEEDPDKGHSWHTLLKNNPKVLYNRKLMRNLSSRVRHAKIGSTARHWRQHAVRLHSGGTSALKAELAHEREMEERLYGVVKDVMVGRGHDRRMSELDIAAGRDPSFHVPLIPDSGKPNTVASVVALLTAQQHGIKGGTSSGTQGGFTWSKVARSTSDWLKVAESYEAPICTSDGSGTAPATASSPARRYAAGSVEEREALELEALTKEATDLATAAAALVAQRKSPKWVRPKLEIKPVEPSTWAGTLRDAKPQPGGPAAHAKTTKGHAAAAPSATGAAPSPPDISTAPRTAPRASSDGSGAVAPTPRVAFAPSSGAAGASPKSPASRGPAVVPPPSPRAASSKGGANSSLTSSAAGHQASSQPSAAAGGGQSSSTLSDAPNGSADSPHMLRPYPPGTSSSGVVSPDTSFLCAPSQPPAPANQGTIDGTAGGTARGTASADRPSCDDRAQRLAGASQSVDAVAAALARIGRLAQPPVETTELAAASGDATGVSEQQDRTAGAPGDQPPCGEGLAHVVVDAVFPAAGESNATMPVPHVGGANANSSAGGAPGVAAVPKPVASNSAETSGQTSTPHRTSRDDVSHIGLPTGGASVPDTCTTHSGSASTSLGISTIVEAVSSTASTRSSSSREASQVSSGSGVPMAASPTRTREVSLQPSREVAPPAATAKAGSREASQVSVGSGVATPPSPAGTREVSPQTSIQPERSSPVSLKGSPEPSQATLGGGRMTPTPPATSKREAPLSLASPTSPRRAATDSANGGSEAGGHRSPSSLGRRETVPVPGTGPSSASVAAVRSAGQLSLAEPAPGVSAGAAAPSPPPPLPVGSLSFLSPSSPRRLGGSASVGAEAPPWGGEADGVRAHSPSSGRRTPRMRGEPLSPPSLGATSAAASSSSTPPLLPPRPHATASLPILPLLHTLSNASQQALLLSSPNSASSPMRNDSTSASGTSGASTPRTAAAARTPPSAITTSDLRVTSFSTHDDEQSYPHQPPAACSSSDTIAPPPQLSLPRSDSPQPPSGLRRAGRRASVEGSFDSLHSPAALRYGAGGGAGGTDAHQQYTVPPSYRTPDSPQHYRRTTRRASVEGPADLSVPFAESSSGSHMAAQTAGRHEAVSGVLYGPALEIAPQPLRRAGRRASMTEGFVGAPQYILSVPQQQYAEPLVPTQPRAGRRASRESSGELSSKPYVYGSYGGDGMTAAPAVIMQRRAGRRASMEGCEEPQYVAMPTEDPSQRQRRTGRRASMTDGVGMFNGAAALGGPHSPLPNSTNGPRRGIVALADSASGGGGGALRAAPPPQGRAAAFRRHSQVGTDAMLFMSGASPLQGHRVEEGAAFEQHHTGSNAHDLSRTRPSASLAAAQNSRQRRSSCCLPDSLTMSHADLLHDEPTQQHLAPATTATGTAAATTAAAAYLPDPPSMTAAIDGYLPSPPMLLSYAAADTCSVRTSPRSATSGAAGGRFAPSSPAAVAASTAAVVDSAPQLQAPPWVSDSSALTASLPAGLHQQHHHPAHLQASVELGASLSAFPNRTSTFSGARRSSFDMTSFHVPMSIAPPPQGEERHTTDSSANGSYAIPVQLRRGSGVLDAPAFTRTSSPAGSAQHHHGARSGGGASAAAGGGSSGGNLARAAAAAQAAMPASRYSPSAISTETAAAHTARSAWPAAAKPKGGLSPHAHAATPEPAATSVPIGLTPSYRTSAAPGYILPLAGNSLTLGRAAGGAAAEQNAGALTAPRLQPQRNP